MPPSHPPVMRPTRLGTKRRWRSLLGVALASAVALPLIPSLPGTAAPAEELGVLDRIHFGDPASESAHELQAEHTSITTGEAGQPARVAELPKAGSPRLGDLTFTVDVDPHEQNYLSLKVWGGEASSNKTVLLVDGAYAQYRNQGDLMPINIGTGSGLPGQFLFTTSMLPLEQTQGLEEVTVTLRTTGSNPSTQPAPKSRRYYEAISHTDPELELPDADQLPAPARGVAPATPQAEQERLVASYRQAQLDRFAQLTSRADADPAAKMSIERYKDDLRFYADALQQDWSPAQTPDEKAEALQRIFDSIDLYTKQYYGDVLSLGTGGHQSDWGGYYGALGEALYIVENQIADPDVLGTDAFQDYLDQPFQTGTTDGANSLAGVDLDGGQLTRGEAWERVMKANFDFARSRLSYIYNQMMYTYEGAWKAHEGLRVIDSEFYQGRERSHAILGEALGSRPFLGEEVLVGPDGEDLDLYHGLFNHDRNAVYTEDFQQVVMKGLAQSKLDQDGQVVRRKPYGEHYTGLTQAGLTRENGYVGGYGESTVYLPTWIHRLTGHAGDEAMADEILRVALTNLHARGQTRYQGVDAQGNRAMLMNQTLDERNTTYPGRMAYNTDKEGGRSMLWASLERYMVEHADRYRGKEWDDIWEYAREGVGWMQQQLVDNQYFVDWNVVISKVAYDHELPETYAYVTGGRAEVDRFGTTAAGVVMPHTDLDVYTDEELSRLGVDRDEWPAQQGWVDVDNMMLSARDGDTDLQTVLSTRARGWVGASAWHVQQPSHEQWATVASRGVFSYQDHYLRPASTEEQIIYDRYSNPDENPFGLVGQLIPITYQPGVGTVDRDNFLADSPYAGYPDLVTSRFGDYLGAINTTRKEYGNSRVHEVALPAGFTGKSVLDLVSGKELRVAKGRVLVKPEQGVILKLTDTPVLAEAPEPVDVAVATASGHGDGGQVGLQWGPVAAAESYTISRSTKPNGRGAKVVAEDVTDTSWVDTDAPSGAVHYSVQAVNEHGLSAAHQVSTKVTASTTKLPAPWRHDRLGTTTGSATVEGDTITLSAGDGEGFFDDGDDYNFYRRAGGDSLHQVSQLAAGDIDVSGKIESHQGEVTGITLRDQNVARARSVYLGADAEGKLELRLRSLDTRVNLGTGLAGQTAGEPITMTPRTEKLAADVATTPWLRLRRLSDTEQVAAQVSADGRTWATVAVVDNAMSEALHAGVVASDAGRLSAVSVSSSASSPLVVRGRFADRQVHLSWTAPDRSVAFEVYRTRDADLAATDPQTTDGWERVLERRWALTTSDEVFGGSMHYKVVAHLADGSTVVSDEAASVTAESLAEALEEARALDPDDWTEASWKAFLAETDRIEEAAGEPDADSEELIAQLYAAYDLLVARFSHSFEADEADVWGTGGTAPASYTRQIAGDGGRTGERYLSWTSTDTASNGTFNVWFNSRKQGVSPIVAEGGSTVRLSFWYQLEDYVPGPGLGAYAFIRSYDGARGINAEQRNWLRAGDTPEGQWVKFQRDYRVEPGANNVELSFGLRGSSGEFRVDDVVVEPVG